MAFDGITVAAVVQELEHTLVGGRISKIAQPENDELLLTIKEMKDKKGSISLPSAFTSTYHFKPTENKPSPMTAPDSACLLRKHIRRRTASPTVSQPSLRAYHPPGY